MHFVGMLAMHVGVQVHYNLGLTLLSGFASIAASYIAFRATLREEVDLLKLGVGGFFMGMGIVIMHYTGMAAMHADAVISYEPWILACSVAVALAASYAALYLFRLFRFAPDFNVWKMASSLVMGVAVCGMHYTGMAAARFQSDSAVSSAGSDFDPYLLAAVSVIALVIVGTLIGALFFDRNVLERMAYLDSLTSLPNRHGLHRYFEGRFSAANGGAVLFIDLDRFKTVNDTLGHDVGDLLLQQLSERLRETIAGEEKAELFRLGGDEFLLAWGEPSVDKIEALAVRILRTLKQPFVVNENVLYMTASIGISLAPAHGTERSALMKAADTALYRSKAAGKNRYCIYDENMEREQFRRLELERDLRKAYAERQFFVVYQPKWDSVSDCLSGMEALLRWRHPQLGIISPMEFIPIAEESGLIIPITEWVIDEVCGQNRKWHDSGVASVPVSVNMSRRMFESEDLFEVIAASLERYRLPGSTLEIEITESVAMNASVDVVGQLQRIRALGVRVSMDDFGTGYSSLGSLDEMPVDILKIDQVFIRKSNIQTKRAIISNIIAIARNLELEVVAEGVETKEQMEFLQARGCRLIQGYYYGKPMPPEEFGLWLDQRAMTGTEGR